MPLRRSLLQVIAALSWVLAPSAAGATWTHDPVANLPVCTHPSSNNLMSLAPDGSGGAYVVWDDNRGGTSDIFAAHIKASGVMDPSWPAGGLPVCTATGDQGSPAILADNAGGAFVVWYDGRFFGQGGVYAHHLLDSGLDATWPVDGRGMVVGAGLGGAPKLVSNGSGGLIATWFDSRAGNPDIFAQHMLSTGLPDPAWPATGRALCSATGIQWFQQITTDMAGGAIVTWEDLRGGGTSDVYAQRVLANGTVDPAWPVNGRAICTAIGNQPQPQICSDGAGGAIITWGDFRSTADVYAQRVLVSGAVDPVWPVDGRVLCNAVNAQDGPSIQSDGSGGALVVWSDARSGSGTRDSYATRVMSYGLTHPSWPVNGLAVNTSPGSQYPSALVPDDANGMIILWTGQDGAAPDVQAQHLRLSGSLDPFWPAAGSTICSAPNNQSFPYGVPDGTGGAIVVWIDSRNGNNDIYGQRIARTGEIGTPEPANLSARDVPNDEGGKVKLSWDASYLDYETIPALVDNYRVYRSVPPALASAAARVQVATRSIDAREFELLVELSALTGTAWEFVTTIPAENVSFITQYSYVASTLSDSTGSSNPSTSFLVAGFNAAGDRYWYSQPASGYSVDNLPPGAPTMLTGNYAAGATHLHWMPNAESDLFQYRLYRGSAPSFVPGADNLVASPNDTGYVDSGSAGAYYKLSAVDVHGNESGFALLTPASTAAVGGASDLSEITFAPPHPNPAVADARLRFALPRATPVRLAVFDLNGRQVRVLLDAVVPAGEQSVIWNLRDERGHVVRDGIYFILLDTPEVRRSGRLVVAR